MLNRKLVLGGLVAGAFLLPAVAFAGVTGVCSNCHTMHASQNGQASTAQNTLLKAGADCVACHAIAGVENGTNGRGTDTIKAPQVDGTGLAGTYVNNAGFFDNAADDNTHHNVVGIGSASGHGDSNMINAGATVAPGGTFSLGTLAAPVLACNSCHGGSGAHHGTTPSSYRILTNNAGGAAINIATSAQTDFGAAAGPADEGTRSEVAYDATNANLFCAGCHGGFHGNANQQGAAPAGTWIRHPTDVSMAAERAAGTAPSIVAGKNATNDTDAVVIGSVGATNDVVMCLSCHLPHGGKYADLLAFPYDATHNAAGDATASPGCETCHSYGVTGM